MSRQGLEPSARSDHKELFVEGSPLWKLNLAIHKVRGPGHPCATHDALGRGPASLGPTF